VIGTEAPFSPRPQAQLAGPLARWVPRSGLVGTVFTGVSVHGRREPLTSDLEP